MYSSEPFFVVFIFLCWKELDYTKKGTTVHYLE